MEAHLLALNNFHMPKVYTDHNAHYMHIMYLLLLEKGKFQSHPDMGVDIRGRYRYNNDESMLYNLQEDIKYQIDTYLPEVSNVEEVTCTLNRDIHLLTIVIRTIDEDVYALRYNPVDNKLESAENEIFNQNNEEY